MGVPAGVGVAVGSESAHRAEPAAIERTSDGSPFDTWPFVGRSTELARVSAALEPGAFVFVGGPGGVGKSALVRECGRRAQQSHWVPSVLTGHAATPLAPMLPRPSGNPTAAPRTLVVVDDAHLLGAVESAVLDTLVRQGTVGFLLSVTTAGHGRLPEAVEALLGSESTSWLQLAPLPDQDLQELVAAALGAPCEPRTLQRLLTACNRHLPALRELISLGRADGQLRVEGGLYRWRGAFAPSGALAQRVDSELGSLTGEQRAALELLALADPLDMRVAQHLAPAPIWVELERRCLVTGQQSNRRLSVTFTQTLHRQRMVQSIPAGRRKGQLARLAAAMNQQPQRRRGDRARAVSCSLDAHLPLSPDALVEAARDAWHSAELHVALRLAAQAHRVRPDSRTAVLLSEVLAAVGRPQEADAVLAETAERFSNHPVPPELILQRAANLAFGLGRPQDALALLSTASTDSPPAWEIGRTSLQASISYQQGQPVEAVQALLAGASSSPAEGRELTQPAALLVYATSDLGRSGEALALADRYRLVSARQQTRRPWTVAELDFGRWRALLRLGRLEEAAAFARENYQQCSDAGHEHCQRIWAVARGLVALHRGMVRTAFWELSEAIADERPLPPFLQLTFARGLAEARAYLPDPAGAPQPTSPAEWTTQSTSEPWRRAWQAVSRGELGTARAAFASVATATAARGQRVQEMEALDALVRIGAGRAAARRLSTVAAGVDGPRAACIGQRARGLQENDPALLTQAANSFAGLGMLLAAAETAAFGATLQRQSNPELARQESTRALLWEARCEGALTPASRGREASSLLLTPREREIGQLAATGLTSPTIAARLHISVRTVEAHLYNCYHKLGLQRRDELVSVFPR